MAFIQFWSDLCTFSISWIAFQLRVERTIQFFDPTSGRSKCQVGRSGGSPTFPHFFRMFSLNNFFDPDPIPVFIEVSERSRWDASNVPSSFSMQLELQKLFKEECSKKWGKVGDPPLFPHLYSLNNFFSSDPIPDIVRVPESHCNCASNVPSSFRDWHREGRNVQVGRGKSGGKWGIPHFSPTCIPWITSWVLNRFLFFFEFQERLIPAHRTYHPVFACDSGKVEML